MVRGWGIRWPNILFLSFNQGWFRTSTQCIASSRKRSRLREKLRYEYIQKTHPQSPNPNFRKDFVVKAGRIPWHWTQKTVGRMEDWGPRELWPQSLVCRWKQFSVYSRIILIIAVELREENWLSPYDLTAVRNLLGLPIANALGLRFSPTESFSFALKTFPMITILANSNDACLSSSKTAT